MGEQSFRGRQGRWGSFYIARRRKLGEAHDPGHE
jgi:hypothetical protein